MLHIIYGTDSFTARHVLRDVLVSTSTNTVESGSVHWIDGKSATPSQVLEACEQVSLFGDRRLVVVEGLLARFGKGDSKDRGARSRGRGKRPSELGEWEPFVARVQVLPEASVLILLDGDLTTTNPLLIALAPGATVNRLDPPAGQALVQWVQRRVAALDGSIDGDAAQRLAALVGSNLWQLNSEIEKLVTFADANAVTTGMVDNLVADSPTPNVFMLVDAIVERNQRLARRRLDDMYQKGLSAGYVFSMLTRQLRLIAMVQESTDRRNKTGSSSAELQGLAPFALQRATQQAQRYSEAQVRYALIRVVEADRGIKTGRSTDLVALDMLITDLLNSASA